MNCMHCDTLLPPGALFCGECGRAVGSTSGASTQPRNLSTSSAATGVGVNTVTAPARWVEDPVTGEALSHDDHDFADVPDDDEIDVEIGTGQARCEQCSNVMALDDIFCGECGFVSRAITSAFSGTSFIGETRPIDLRLDLGLLPDTELENEFENEVEAVLEAVVDSVPVDSVPIEPVETVQPESVLPEPEAEPNPEPSPASRPDLVLPFSPPILSPKTPVPRSFMPPAPVRSGPPGTPVPSVRRTPAFLDDDGEDFEATRIVQRSNRFVLQFSTGESFTVHGTGLIGRNPQPEPGEFFDHLVRVLDTGKSVSKTHLEFGQENGAFWVKDRFSGNGTILREPEVSARRAEADRRYRVVRGTRIDIGEQFFVVS